MDPIRPVVGGAVALVLGLGVFTVVHFAGGGAPIVPPVPTPTNYLPAPADGPSVSPTAPTPPAIAEPPSQEQAAPTKAAAPRQAAPAPRQTTRSDADGEQLPTRVPADVPYASGDRLRPRSIDGTARDPRFGDDHNRDDNKVEDQMIQRMCDRGNLPAAYCGPADRDSYSHR